MLKALKEEVLEANLEVVRRGLVLYTFGNASGIDRKRGLVVIKPSGVDYARLKASDMVVLDLDGKVVEGRYRPSSDTATHLVLYRAFEGVGGIVHTHSRAATAWAQAQREIPCLGTTHADYFHGAIPVTPELSAEEIHEGYEANTGHAIVRRFAELDPLAIPAVLVAGHAPFVWGPTPAGAASNAVILEEVAHLAMQTMALRSDCPSLPGCLHDKHFLRKHGASAYYGQQ
ncbi:MAG: L-ribulose-5-phosphate 4-epimerase [Bryobacterales bacterium]|jgi:L-ribulose-5-phosphate 4-epimerase|nr:L-ribulose-5-phosphate 4-epimerase [Bryobacterales bacterium]